MTRTIAQLGATGSSTATSVSVTLAYPAFSTMFFVPKSPYGAIDLALTITQSGAQAITAAPSMATGTPGIPGTVIVMTANHAGTGPDASMLVVGGYALIGIPLSNGKAAQLTTTFTVLQVLHQMTIDFFGWTPHALILSGLTSKGVAQPNVSAMGSFNLSAYGAGTVTLVSPSRISINGSLAQRRSASFTTLKLSFSVPEPGTALLLGAGLFGLLALRRRS